MVDDILPDAPASRMIHIMKLEELRDDLTDIMLRLREIKPSREVSIAATNVEQAMLWVRRALEMAEDVDE